MTTERNSSWLRKVRKLISEGFTREEAEWAASSDIKLGDHLVQTVRRFRKAFIRDFLVTFPGATREGAIRQASKQLRDRNMRFGLTGEDVYNIFREVSL